MVYKRHEPALNACQLLPTLTFDLEVNAPLRHTFIRQNSDQLCPQLPDNTLRCVAVRTLELDSTCIISPSGVLIVVVQATLIPVLNMRRELEQRSWMLRIPVKVERRVR